MYRIKVNDRLTELKFAEEHAARLVYAECIRLAENNKLQLHQPPTGQVPKEIVLYYQDPINSGLVEVERWQPAPPAEHKETDEEWGGFAENH